MSTQNRIQDDEVTVKNILEKYFQRRSLDVIKSTRFGFGNVNQSEMREMLRLDRIFTDISSLTEDEKMKLKNEILKKSV